MQVIKHGDHHWESTETCYSCEAELLVSSGDVLCELGSPASRFYFICPECSRRNYKDRAEVPEEVRSDAQIYRRDVHLISHRR